MKTKMFDELLGSIREGGAILRGRKKPSRCFVVEAAGVCQLRRVEGTAHRLVSALTHKVQ